MKPRWRDSEAPWWAKLRRAQRHIAEAGNEVTRFEQRKPWSIKAEESAVGELAYRFHVLAAIPSDLVTILSDAIHNLRTAVDTFVYDLARQHLGEELNATQERQTRFQSFKTVVEFEEFYHRPREHALYGERGIAALRCVQPFSFMEESASILGVADTAYPEADWHIDTLRRLNELSNIDKHRRLPTLGWSHHSCSWSGGKKAATYHWRGIAGALYDAVKYPIVGYLATTDGPAIDLQVDHDVRLVFLDDPLRYQVVELLTDWHSTLSSWVLPRMILVAEGNKAPMMIVHEPPSAHP